MSAQIELKLDGNNLLRFVSQKTRMLTHQLGYFKKSLNDKLIISCVLIAAPE